MGIRREGVIMITHGLVNYDDLFEVLKEMSAIFNKYKIKWSLAISSVLGAVRSNDFIKNQDICISVYLFEVARPIFDSIIIDFKNRGFEACHIYSAPGLFRRGTSGIEIHPIGKAGHYYKYKEYRYLLLEHFEYQILLLLKDLF